jgi:hypothetical protein
LEKAVRPFPLKSKLFPNFAQRNRRVLAGKPSQEGQELGIVREQFSLDFEVAELRNERPWTLAVCVNAISFGRRLDFHIAQVSNFAWLHGQFIQDLDHVVADVRPHAKYIDGSLGIPL